MDPATFANQLDASLHFSDEQLLAVIKIFTQESDELSPLPPDIRAGRLRPVQQEGRAKIRELLTPKQQTNFDTNPAGFRDLDARAFVFAYLMASPEVSERVGSVKSIEGVGPNGHPLGGFTATPDERVPSGFIVYRVIGTKSTDTFKVYWARTGGKFQITSLVPTSGSEDK